MSFWRSTTGPRLQSQNSRFSARTMNRTTNKGNTMKTKILALACLALLSFQSAAYAGLKAVATSPSAAITSLPVPVNQGGTGASTLTGVLVGNGTSAVT